MPDVPNNTSSPRGWIWCFEKSAAIVVGLLLFVTMGVTVNDFVSWYLTTPNGGFTCRYSRKASGVAGDAGGTILIYEVYNPGPGTLPNIHLEIDVEDGDYDEVAQKFSTGLVCRFLQATSGDIKTNGEVTSITVMPRTGGKCCMMSPGDTFSVVLIAPDEEWWPRRVSICCTGEGVIDILKKTLRRSHLRFAGISYWLTVLAPIVLALAMILWATLRYRNTLDEAERMTKAARRLDWKTLDQTQPRVDILPQIITILKVPDNQNGGDNPPASSQPSQ